MGTHPIFESDFVCLTECCDEHFGLVHVLERVVFGALKWIKIQNYSKKMKLIFGQLQKNLINEFKMLQWVEVKNIENFINQEENFFHVTESKLLLMKDHHSLNYHN